MIALPPALLVSIAVLLAVLISDFWVLSDARDRERRGDPVSVAVGSMRIERPEAWFLGCVVLWVVFMPLYLTATGRNPFARRN